MVNREYEVEIFYGKESLQLCVEGMVKMMAERAERDWKYGWRNGDSKESLDGK